VLMLATKANYHHATLERIHGKQVIFNPFCLRSLS
jgi:hypothetical protein